MPFPGGVNPSWGHQFVAPSPRPSGFNATGMNLRRLIIKKVFTINDIRRFDLTTSRNAKINFRRVFVGKAKTPKKKKNLRKNTAFSIPNKSRKKDDGENSVDFRPLAPQLARGQGPARLEKTVGQQGIYRVRTNNWTRLKDFLSSSIM